METEILNIDQLKSYMDNRHPSCLYIIPCDMLGRYQEPVPLSEGYFITEQNITDWNVLGDKVMLYDAGIKDMGHGHYAVKIGMTNETISEAIIHMNLPEIV